MVGTFLDGRNYTQLRGAAFLFLSEIGNIVSGSVTSDQGGGGTTIWTAGTTDIPCRVDSMGGGEAVMTGKISDRTTHLISIPADADVDTNDRFAIDNRGTFEITAVPENTGDLIRRLEAVQM